MKKLYILLLCGMSTYTYGQQLLNSDFENWTNHPGNSIYSSYDQVDNWATGNAVLDLIPNASPPTIKTTDAQIGKYAAKLTTQFFFNQIAAGNLFTGTFKLDLQTPVNSAKIGIPYSSRPTAFSVYYKYTPVKGDSCSIYVLLTKYNSSTKSKDTIGLASFISSNLVTTYTLLTIPIVYKSDEIPDEISAVFSSSADGGHFKGQAGSSLTVDNFSLLGLPLTTITPLSTTSAALYPNPAQSTVHLSNAPSESGTMNFYNASGALVSSQKWDGTRTPEFSLENMPAGFYTCKFITSESIIYVSKLIISE